MKALGRHFVPFLFVLAAYLPSPAEEPCTSGLQPGHHPGPYSAIISTGPQRGRSYCYICETADRPAVVIFARSLSDPLGRLVHQLDRAVGDHSASELRSWVTFLGDDQPTLDGRVVAWGRKHAIVSLPLGVFEDVNGPPSYRLAQDADVTVLLFVKRDVVANFAFRTSEVNDERLAVVLKALPQILASK